MSPMGGSKYLASAALVALLCAHAPIAITAEESPATHKPGKCDNGKRENTQHLKLNYGIHTPCWYWFFFVFARSSFAYGAWC